MEESHAPSFKALQTLRLVGEHGNQQLAGVATNQTQSNVSQTIARLEEQLGTKLVRRIDVKPRKVLELTEAGEMVAQFGEGVTAAWHEVMTHVALLNSRQKGGVTTHLTQ